MIGLLIALVCIGVAAVTGGAAAFWWVRRELLWLRAVLIPWMVAIHKLIEGKQ